MACGCSKNRTKHIKVNNDIMSGYKYLKPNQIKARLEIFKRNNCADCTTRYECDYDKYALCKGDKQQPPIIK